VVDAFLAASRGGDLGALLEVLDPDVVLRADETARRTGALDGIRGAQGVAQQFFGRAQAARPALIDGSIGLLWAPRGRPRVAFLLDFTDDKIAGIHLVADPQHIGQLDWEILDE
jgi:hypothetical protein